MSEVAEKIILPKERSKPESKDPKILVLYGPPKIGKTTAVSQLDNNLILELEDGARFLDIMKIDIKNLAQLKEVGREIIKQGKPYKYITLDTITLLEEWCEMEATRKYKETLIGKNFKGNTILTLPNGAGYGLLREEVMPYVRNILPMFADNIIIIGHLKDKLIVDKKGTEVTAKDIDLMGKLRNMVCAQADAVGYLFREDGSLMVSFDTKEEIVCGSRCDHLKGQTFEFDWNKIYID